MTVWRSQVIGCGAYLPERIVTNDDMTRYVDTTDEWIVERTGIRERRIAAEGEKTSDLAFAAARMALENAGLAAADIDMIVLATATPDNTFPATATRVQHMLGMSQGFAFDVQAVCSGFIYALSVADNFIKSGQVRTALVIGAETFSRLLDKTDRSTFVLFGDGAGAVVLKAAEGEGDVSDRGVLSTHLHSDGKYYDMLYVDGGPSSTQTTGHLRMEGREVFRHAVTNLAAVVNEVLNFNGIQVSDINWLIPHQANSRIIEGTARKLKMSMDRVVMTVDKQANTSAASIPLALAGAVNDGKILPNQLVLLESMGGGFTWGACLLRM